MTNTSTTERIQPAERVFSPPAIIAAAFLALHVVPLVWRPIPMWGFDFLCYMPTWVQVAFVLLAVLLFVPRFQHLCRTCVTSLPFALWGNGRRVRVTRTLVVVAALAIFVMLSSARHFLGDGYHVLEKLDAKHWHDKYRAPLTYTLIGTLHRLSSTFWETAENTYRVYSYVSGTLYVLLSFPVAAALAKNGLERSIFLAFLLTAGFIQQFFGYVENYALYLPGVLLYLFLGQRTLENRISLYVPALLLGMLVAFHRALTIFGPSLLYLAYRDFRRRNASVPTWKNILATAAGLCCLPISAAVFLALSGVGFEAYITWRGSSEFLPLLEQPGFFAQYRIFSFQHLLDFGNLQLLSAPAAYMALFLVRTCRLGHQAFLTISAAIPLFFTFVAKPNLGAFRDWDVLSLSALPLILCAGTAFVERICDRERLFHASFLICGAAALHTLFWVGVNASAEPAEARFTNQLGILTGQASASGWISLGKFHEQQGNTQAALEANKLALNADSTNAHRWLGVGAILGRMGQTSDAIEHYRRAAELRPDQAAIPFMNLGAAYNDIGQFDKAIEYTRKAIELEPDLASAHLNLGAIYRKAGQHDKAIEHLEKAIELLEKVSALRPAHGAIHVHLGMAYRSTGQNARAIKHLERAHALRPRHTPTLVNLAVACSDEGQNERAIGFLKKAAILEPGLPAVHANIGAVYGRLGEHDTAIRHLQHALELQPENPETYKNLGLIYKAQGRYPQAIEQFEKALELQGDQANAMAYLNIGDAYYQMRKYDEAIPYFRKAIQLNPDHADAHLLLGLSFRALNLGHPAGIYLKKTLEIEPNHPQAAQIGQWLGQIRE